MQLAQKCAVFQILLDKIHLYFRVSFPLMVWCTRQMGQGNRNLIKFFNYPNDTINKVWPEFIIWVKR